jgi:hypothetical protein
LTAFNLEDGIDYDTVEREYSHGGSLSKLEFHDIDEDESSLDIVIFVFRFFQFFKFAKEL